MAEEKKKRECYVKLTHTSRTGNVYTKWHFIGWSVPPHLQKLKSDSKYDYYDELGNLCRYAKF
ncbi:MAG: hypothetical protein K2H01_11090 [Ruminococcus sp.]|nr:hypothetical protein [Ruminococcus sp.]